MARLFSRYRDLLSTIRARRSDVIIDDERVMLLAIDRAEVDIDSTVLSIYDWVDAANSSDAGDDTITRAYRAVAEGLVSEMRAVLSVFDGARTRRSGAGCAAASDAVSASVTGFCLRFLRPFNGFWFSAGWSAFFLMPTLLLSLGLSRLYGNTSRFRHAITLEDIKQCLARPAASMKGAPPSKNSSHKQKQDK